MTGTWVLDDVAFGARLAAAWRHVLVVAAAVRRGRLQAQHPPQSRAARPSMVHALLLQEPWHLQLYQLLRLPTTTTRQLLPMICDGTTAWSVTTWTTSVEAGTLKTEQQPSLLSRGHRLLQRHWFQFRPHSGRLRPR